MKRSEKIKYKGKMYYIDSSAYSDKSNTKLFLYIDPELKKVAKSGSKTLMVKKSDIDYKLKETMKKSELIQIIREEARSILNESLFTDENTAKSVESELEKKINVPWKSVGGSTLGNYTSIILKLSLDKKSDWSNGIIHNSRYMMFHIYQDGTIELFSRGIKFKQQNKPKFRKTKVKDTNQLINKINTYIKQVS